MIARRILQSSVDVIPWRVRGIVRRIPLLRSVQRWILRRYLGGVSFVHTINAGPAKGVRFQVTLPDDKLIWTGTWEMELASAIGDSIRTGDVCYDVGSYRGFFAGVMGASGAARIHCFEPNPSNLAQLERLQELNPHLPIEVHAIGIGEVDGVGDFLIMREATMGKLVTSAFQRTAERVDTLQVRIARVDTLVELEMIAPPNVMKIDVEGAELEVIRGAQKTLVVSKPVLFIEAHSPDLARDCEDLLLRLGYSVSVLETGHGVETAASLDVCHLVARNV